MSPDRFNSSSYINFEQRLALRQKDDETYLVSKEVWHQPKTVQFRKDEGIAAFRVNAKTQEERVNDKMSAQVKFDPDNFNNHNMTDLSFSRVSPNSNKFI